MSNGQSKRVNLTLHLNPGDSQADLRTCATLQRWHNKLKQEESSRVDATLIMRAFHRNIYLAGLQLQLLSPQLCHHVAESISRENMTLPDLVTELVRCELLPAGTPINTSVSGEFSEQQLKQLQQMNTAQHADFSPLCKNLEQIRTLLENQSLQLAQLSRSDTTQVQEVTSKGGSEEMDLNEIAVPIEKMKKIRQKGIF